jgi:hypothetical protein
MATDRSARASKTTTTEYLKLYLALVNREFIDVHWNYAFSLIESIGDFAHKPIEVLPIYLRHGFKGREHGFISFQETWLVEKALRNF